MAPACHRRAWRPSPRKAIGVFVFPHAHAMRAAAGTPIAFMAYDVGAAELEDEVMWVGSAAVRAKLFAHVDGVLLVPAAARPAGVTLTASYEGTVTLLGTPGAGAVAAALAQASGSISAHVVLSLPDAEAGGAYTLHGSIRGRRFVLGGTNGSGAELHWRGRLTLDRGLRGPVRIVVHGTRMVGMLAVARKRTPGSGANAYVSDAVVSPGGSDTGTGESALISLSA